MDSTLNICSLLPSGTEIAFALGLGDSIVGVTDLCDYPDEAKNKPIVSRSRIDVSSLSSAEVETATVSYTHLTLPTILLV